MTILAVPKPCPYCDKTHRGLCPMVKSLTFWPDGRKTVEFWPPELLRQIVPELYPVKPFREQYRDGQAVR